MPDVLLAYHGAITYEAYWNMPHDHLEALIERLQKTDGSR